MASPYQVQYQEEVHQNIFETLLDIPMEFRGESDQDMGHHLIRWQWLRFRPSWQNILISFLVLYRLDRHHDIVQDILALLNHGLQARSR